MALKRGQEIKMRLLTGTKWVRENRRKRVGSAQPRNKLRVRLQEEKSWNYKKVHRREIYPKYYSSTGGKEKPRRDERSQATTNARRDNKK